jgi:hypothetical protein
MVSTPKLTMATTTDTVGLVRFRFFFLASAVWVATIVVAAREEDIFLVARCVRRGVAALDSALRDAVGASSLLPIVESERYSSMGGGRAACTSAASRTL